MTRIGVFHRDFRNYGGGEAVCMHVLEALSNRYDTTLLTVNDVELAHLDIQYGTETSDIEVDTLSLLGLPINSVDYLIKTFLNRNALGYIKEVQYLLPNQAVKSELDRFDLIVVTSHELAADTLLIQYVHFPKFNREANPTVDTPTGPLFNAVSSLMTALWQRADFPGRLLTNSRWTKQVIQQTYQVDAEVVYPPIQVEQFEPTLPDNNRFIIAGRIERGKRIFDAIEIIRRVHDRGFNVELEITGVSEDCMYASKVREQAADLPYVSVAGHLPFSEYVTRLEQARYGLHCKPKEHFGIAIAEMVAAGALPFVPDTGGQTEIVDDHPTLLYDSINAAVNQICYVLADPQVEQDIRTQLPNADRYSADRFAETVRSVVKTELASKRHQHN